MNDSSHLCSVLSVPAGLLGVCPAANLRAGIGQRWGETSAHSVGLPLPAPGRLGPPARSRGGVSLTLCPLVLPALRLGVFFLTFGCLGRCNLSSSRAIQMGNSLSLSPHPTFHPTRLSPKALLWCTWVPEPISSPAHFFGPRFSQ